MNKKKTQMTDGLWARSSLKLEDWEPAQSPPELDDYELQRLNSRR